MASDLLLFPPKAGTVIIPEDDKPAWVRVMRDNSGPPRVKMDSEPPESFNGTNSFRAHPEQLPACSLPPRGWKCSRPSGHDGPCAASPDENDTPDASTRAEADDLSPLPWDAEDQALAEYGMATEAERAVLAAMAALRSEWLIEMLGADRCFPNCPDCIARVRLHEAELARRGLRCEV